MDDKVLQKPVLKDYGETVVTANSGTSYTIDLTAGNVFNITLTGNCAFTFANPPASGTSGSFSLILAQDSTGARTVAWPSAVLWSGGSEPTLYDSGEHLLTFSTLDGGTTWYGSYAGGIETFEYNFDFRNGNHLNVSLNIYKRTISFLELFISYKRRFNAIG